MLRRIVPVLALAITAAYTGDVHADDPAPAAAQPESAETKDKGEKKEDRLPAYVLPAALIAAGVAGVAALAARHGSGGGGGNSGAGPGTVSAGGNPPRTLTYTSAADFETGEYDAQQGLASVKAASMYYNGHYRWFTGAAPDSAAGTGIGVKIAVADTGINPRESTTGSAIAIDVAASYDYINNRPGAAADDFGHGTHVAGIIAAPKNGVGMHGLAYNATLVNFKVGNSSGAITASDAQLADMMNRAANAGAMIINNSWSLAGSSITSFTAQDLSSSMPRMIDASRAYVAAGGVVVFAAGNDAAANPSLQSGLPYRIGGIQSGWLAVVAVDDTGKLASYSNHCGVAAAWCLAAPGGTAASGIYSMYNNGGYASMYGTSMAAPHASAAVAALKSMFVNLSYLQIRDRLLYTANRSGAYADANTYGQGMMDLDAASSPVGGIAVPTGASATGAIAPVAASAIVFQAGAVTALGIQPRVLVVDNYQRAPFWVPSGTFFREATPHLTDRQWASLMSSPLASRIEKIGPRLRLSQSPGLNSAMSADLGNYRLGFAQGADGERALSSQLDLASVPRLVAPGTDSATLGYASDAGSMRFGFIGAIPTVGTTEARTLDASSLGGRRALAGIAQRGDATATYGVTFALADHFERPIGIATSGAFGVDESSAVSTGAFVQHVVGASSVLEASFELAHHRPQASAALSSPEFAVRSVSLGARTAFGSKTMLSANLKRESTRGEAAQLNLPLTIAENGDIGRVTYTLPYDDLVGRTALNLRVDHQFNKQTALRAAFTRERYGFGTTITGVAAMVEITN